ncbi:hypothetical protein ARAM_004932 [Aspergillus rambellii]|uniref:Uncharacterized protein n=1 Tax=Aspergillus rambellii TaxID=308745 RepID=A0A0F8XUR9_9EURO|nr:hypothetical protein ARAM_004932 [Aspergillus rambellii]
MAQPFYSLDDGDCFDPQSKRDALSIPHAIQNDNQQEMVDMNTGCLNTGPEIDAKGRGSTRRRIQVAVNSAVVQTKVSSWPYPTNTIINPSQRPGAPDSQPAFSWQSFGLDATNHEDGGPAPYNAPSSTFLLPNSPQGVMAECCGLTWNAKAWSSGIQSGRAANEAMFGGNYGENPLALSGYLFTGQGTQSTEISPIVPTQASLTFPIQGAERTLPTPSNRNPFQGNVGGLVASPNALAGLQSAQEYKSGNHWMQKNDPRTPMQPTSNKSFSTRTVNRAKLIPSGAQDIVFGVLPIATTSAVSPLMPSSGAFTGLIAATDSADEFRSSNDGRLRAFSRDNTRMLSLTEYGPDSYGYSTSERSGRSRSDVGNASSVATLINGLPYMRPKNPDPISQMNPLTTDSLTGSYGASTETHRTPVSALSNSSGF